MDETDHLGNFWSAVKEQERLFQALRLLDGIKAVPTAQRHKPTECIAFLRELLELNSMEVQRRRMLYEKNIREEGWAAQ